MTIHPLLAAPFVLSCLAVISPAARGAEPPVVRGSAHSETSDLALQVPLARSEKLRAEFAAELKSHPGADLRDFYASWLDRIGANGIVATLKEKEPTCHDRGHDLGKLIYSKIGEIGRALATCDGACNSACMHGVFREALSVEGATADEGHLRPKAVASRVQQACAQSGGYLLGDCLHGLGHAFMYLAGYDIPRAMGYCDQLGDYPKSYYCATGAYMELSNNPPAGFLLGKSLYFPCNQSPYPAACFRYRFPVSLPGFYKSGGNLGQLIRGCMALEGAYRLGCFHGIGNGHLSQLARKPELLGKICGGGEHDDQVVCVEGAVERIARYQPETAVRACGSLPDWRQQICENARKRGLYAMDRSFALYPR
jgi:hypothetical protein